MTRAAGIATFALFVSLVALAYPTAARGRGNKALQTGTWA